MFGNELIILNLTCKAKEQVAKHHLKKLSGKESRFRRSVNHRISKQLVSKAKDTHRCIAFKTLVASVSRLT